MPFTRATRLATPVDEDTYGVHRPESTLGALFTGRITDDGEFTPRPFRYHVYGGWFCPDSHRIALTRELSGLHDLVTMSYVDGACDGRGWAFRAPYGPDPVNGFTLLRQAYEATDEAFTGQPTLPTLWDRFSARVVSTEVDGIEIDLVTRFRHLADPIVDLYPAHLREQIDEAHADPGAPEELDEVLADGRRFLLGDVLTLADVRVFARLSHDEGDLRGFGNLTAYAEGLRSVPAVRTAEGARWRGEPDRSVPPASAA